MMKIGLALPQYDYSVAGENPLQFDTIVHHAQVAAWRRREAIRRTLERRPDLLQNAQLTEQEQRWLDEFRKQSGG